MTESDHVVDKQSGLCLYCGVRKSARQAVKSKEQQRKDRLGRLVETIYKLAGWNGTDISDLIDEGYLQEGDLDQ